MARKVLVLVVTTFLILSFSVSGAKKPADQKMLQRLERLERSDRPDGSEGFTYLTTPEPKVFFPVTGDTAGNSWYDLQQASTMTRHIAYDPTLSLTHIVWHNMIGESPANRYWDYNSWDPVGSWLVAGGMHITPAIQRAGFGGIDLLPDGREVNHMHRTQPDPGNWASQIAIESTTPGLGEFEHYDIPDSFPTRPEAGMWPYMAISKQMRGDTAFIHITPNEGETGGTIEKRLGYVRCFEDPTREDTLVCQSPNTGFTPIVIPKNTQIRPNIIIYSYDGATLGDPTIATSPVSEKVALTYLKNYAPSQTKNDLFYIESTNNGDNWLSAGSMAPIKLTNYEDSFPDLRAYCDLAIVYDYSDELHIMWTTWPSTDGNDVSLWHWSPSLGIRKAAAATASSDLDPGARTVLINKFTIGVWPDSNYLYFQYSGFKDGDVSSNEYANGDLYVKGSTNNGLTWGPEVNMTNTNTNGCLPGNCLSEQWSSIAEVVDDSLHIAYVEDKEAGAAFYDEGAWLPSAIRYLRYPRPSVPAVAQIAYTPSSMYRPFRWATNGGTTKDTLDVDNTGTSTLYVQLSGPAWLTINPTSFSIVEAGPTQYVDLTFNGASFSDTLITDSLLVLSNNGSTGPVYSDTDWVGIHFLVSDEFYRAEEDTCKYEPITRIFNIGNMGIGLDADSVGMFYNGINYLYDFSPIFVTGDIAGSGPVGFHWMHERADFIPESNLNVSHDTMFTDLEVQVFSGKFGLVYPPHESEHRIYHAWWSYWTHYFKMIQLHPQFILVYNWWMWNPPPVWWDNINPTFNPTDDPQGGYFGIAADWDIVSDASGRNLGDYDDTLHLIWQYCDSSGFEAHYGGFLWLFGRVDADTQTGPFGAHVLTNQDQLYPFTGYDNDSAYKYMGTPGYSIASDSSQDMNIMMSFFEEVTSPTTSTVIEMKYALLVSDEGESGLYDVAALAKSLISKTGSDKGKVRGGDANFDGDVSVSDVVYTINFLFKGGPAPWKAVSDTNGDRDISVSDVVYTINFLFKGGPKPILAWCQLSPPW